MNPTIKIALWTTAALLVFGGIALVGLNAQANSENGSTQTAQANPNPSATQDEDVAATITYTGTGTGFEPDLVPINVKNSVRIRNRSQRVLKFVSDPYPTQSNEPELNVGQLLPGESKTFYVTQIGAWGFHNALDPSEVGQIIAQ